MASDSLALVNLPQEHQAHGSEADRDHFDQMPCRELRSEAAHRLEGNTRDPVLILRLLSQ